MSDDLLERLDRGVLHCGLHDDNETELFEVDDANDTMAEAKAEIERLREALLDALSHCYNCSGDPHYIEEDEVTGDHLWTDCPICRSARAALGETK